MPAIAVPVSRSLVQFTIDLLTGTAMAGMLGPGREQTAVVVERWKDALVLLAEDRRR